MMNQQFTQTPSWYNAVTLAERVASLRSTNANADFAADSDAELAARRLQRWQAQTPFTKDGVFARRLAMEGVTETEFFYLLGESAAVLHGRLPTHPEWLDQLADAFLQTDLAATPPPAESFRGREMLGFLSVAAPLIRRGRRRLRAGLREIIAADHAPFDVETAEELLTAGLPMQLLLMLSRTLTLEMHVARLEGKLAGETPEERFNSYLKLLQQPEVTLALLQEYPALARHLTISIANWVNASLEFARHLCADWTDIRSRFTPDAEPGALARVEAGVGDLHRDGRSVVVATFDSGFKLVYKPRSLAIDERFQELLMWLNQRGAQPSFATLKVIDRGGHGWAQFVEAASCESEDEVRRFYERQGGFLALLYALEATDFHYGNLIAAGEHPMLIDLESLFHTRVEQTEATTAQSVVNPIHHSVLRIGLLPQRAWANAESDGIDVSGLGGKQGQLTPQTVPFWDRVGTDEMHVGRRHVELPGEKNRPRLRGAEVEALDYCDEIIGGFEKVYRLLLERRAELLAEDGPLARFSCVEVRTILRPTKSYATMLHESFHPDLLRDGLERERFFDRLWVGIEARPHLTRAISAERQDLLRGDVPLFTTRPDSRDLFTSRGERVADFFGVTGMELVRRRLRGLNAADLERQVWFTRASLATLAMATDGAHWPQPQRVAEPDTPATREQLIEAARAVGDRLQMLSLRAGQDVSWLGLTLIKERHWSLLPLPAGDLYNGLPGVALFLAYLGLVTGDGGYKALAQDTLTTVLRQVERAKPHIKMIGGYEGWGGIIYTLVHLAHALEEPELLTRAEEFVEFLPPLIERDEHLDIMAGVAGCIFSLSALHRSRPSARTLAVAVQCGEHLLARAQPARGGLGWTSLLAKTTPLTGFSHGAAGISAALFELAKLSGQERFRAAAFAGMEYERSLFSAEHGNWPDLREFDQPAPPASGDGEQVSYMTAWCHGAPGIGLARLRALRELDDAVTRDEIDAALRTTLAGGFGGNHSLCHGDLGNLELLLQAREAFDPQRWDALVSRKAAHVLASIESNGWLCGIPLGAESPGLMTGLAGIGYELLRLAEPGRVPSALTLAPPS
jgi:type 2 lantibiotic biosynthesis protein LanM